MNSNQRDAIRKKLDDLIWTYENYRKCGGARIPVAVTPAQLGKILGVAPRHGAANEFSYRDRTIVATAVDPDRARFLGRE